MESQGETLIPKQSAGALFRQIKEAYHQKLIKQFRFAESQNPIHDKSRTICVKIFFQDKTTFEKKDKIERYITDNFRIIESYREDTTNLLLIVVQLGELNSSEKEI